MTSPKKLLNLLIGIVIILLLSLLPCVETTSLYDFTQTGKTLVLISAVSVLCLLASMKNFEKLEIKINKVDLILIILVWYLTLNRYVFQAKHGFSLPFYELIGLSILYFVLRSLPLTHFIFFFAAIILGGSIQALVGNLQNNGFVFSNNSEFPITGNFFNPGPLGGYLSAIMPLFAGVYLFFFESRGEQRLRFKKAMKIKALKILMIFLTGATGINFFLAIYAAESRAATIGLILAFAFLIFTCYGTALFKILKLPVFIKAIALPMVLLLGAWGAYKFYILKKDSADGRVFIDHISLRMISDRPLLGVGFGQYKVHYMDYQAEYLKTDYTSDKSGFISDNDCAFNDPLQFTVENGTIGAFLIGLLFLGLTRIRYETKDRLLMSVIASLLSILVFSFFSYPSQVLPIKLNALVCIAFLASHDKEGLMKINGNRAYSIVGSGFIICFAVLVQYHLQTIYSAYHNWQIANDRAKSSLVTEAIPYYHRGEEVLNDNGYFMQEYGHALYRCSNYRQALIVLTKTQELYNSCLLQCDLADCYKQLHNYAHAEFAYQQAGGMLPGLFYPRYGLAKLYFERGDRPKAISFTRHILTEKVKINSNGYREMVDDLNALLNGEEQK